MTGEGSATYTSPALETAPRRSLDEVQRELRGERITLLYRQLLAKNEAAECVRRIERIDARLRAIDEEMGR